MKFRYHKQHYEVLKMLLQVAVAFALVVGSESFSSYPLVSNKRIHHVCVKTSRQATEATVSSETTNVAALHSPENARPLSSFPRSILFGHKKSFKEDPGALLLSYASEARRNNRTEIPLDFGILGPRPERVLLVGLDQVQYVLADKDHAWGKTRYRKRNLGLFFGRCLGLLDGQEHVERRIIMNSCVEGSVISNFLNVIVAEARRLGNNWGATRNQRLTSHPLLLEDGDNVIDGNQGGSGEAANSLAYNTIVGGKEWQVDATRSLSETMLSTSIRCFLGMDDLEESKVLLQNVRTCLGHLSTLDRGAIRVPVWLPTPSNRRYRVSRVYVDNLVYGLMKERRDKRKAAAVTEISSENTADLMDMLLDARHEDTGVGLSDEEIRNELVLTFVAAFDTSSTASAWTLHYLSKNPDIQTRIAAEAAKVWPLEAGGTSSPLTIGALKDLEYTGWVVSEALRIRPAFWEVTRSCLQKGGQTLPGGFKVKANQMVVISPYVMHHNPQNFPNSTEFIPERFSPSGRKWPVSAYIPFGAGKHRCLGARVAQMDITLLIAYLVSRFHILPEDADHGSPDPGIRCTFVLDLEGGLRLRVRPRS